MTFMEASVVSNLTFGIMPLAHPQSYPTAPFPAWLPAVTVAVSMLLFLAGSFYLRHRKVMKKRQILMDYFYIIFQYGGLRRKRMVTALCNTNAITLRELGRSFMISCDSLAANDNESSCPFYLDESAYSKPLPRRPLTKKYSILKRGFTITRRHRGPFLRFKTMSEENTRQYPHSFQDIVMKLGGRRPQEDSRRVRSTSRHTQPTPQFEGCSMSTIHGDEMEYERPKENSAKLEHPNRQRRNAHILQYDKSIPRFADVAAEAARQSLGQAVPGQFKEQHSPYRGKRNSEPWRQLSDQDSQTQGLQPDVFHVQRGLLSPSNVISGSQGYISSIDKDGNAFQPYRNSEPTILVHSPSVDGDATQGWKDINSRYTNGVVILKRVSKEDGSPGEYYYEETRTPSVDRPVRTSLSKVSYVPSGNMNQYQNCILSPNKDKSSTEEEALSKKTKVENGPQERSKSKRGRLNLGRMGVGNFSRRIDMASDSLQDYEPELHAENKSSFDNENPHKTSPRTTWTRFKSVFSGSREVPNSSPPGKPATFSSVVEQQKVKSKRDRTHWQKFLSVFTGFRSFPEDKKDDDELVNLPKSSVSVPLGLNLIGNNSDANFIDMEEGTMSFDISKHSSPESSKHASLSSASSFSDNARDSSVANSSTVYQTEFQRPRSLDLSSRAQSFPDELIHPRQYLQRFQKAFDHSGLIKNRPMNYRQANKKYGKLNNFIVPNAAPLSKSKRDFKSYSFEAGYCSPGGEYRFKRCPTFMDSPHAATPDRLEGNSSGSEMSLVPRRFRSLSPLLEINCSELNKCTDTKRLTNLESTPSCSVYMTPFENDNIEKNYRSEIKSLEDILHPDVLELERDALEDTSLFSKCQTLLPINSSSDKCDDEHTINTDQTEYAGSQITESNFLKSDFSDVCLQLNSIFGSNDKLPHSYFLKPNHKIASRSTDSVYYDTVSALGSPSSCDLKDTDFAQISHTEHATWGSTEKGVLNFIDNDIQDNILPSSFDAILSPNVSDTQTSSSTDPLINLPGNVPSSQQSNSLSNKSQASVDHQCNKLSYELSPKTYTTQGNDCTAETTTDNLQKLIAQNIECNLIQSIPCTLNERRNRSPILASFFDRGHTGSLPVPVRTSHNSEHHNTSSDTSPNSSRSSTPSRRHSNPSPSPEKSQYGRSGCYTPDQIYMANVTRLPRLSQRLRHSGTMPSLCHVKYIHE